MKKIVLLCMVALVGVGSALTYHVFENAVHSFINFVWYDVFNTDANRWQVIPLALVFSIIFFCLQHLLDRKSEKGEAHGLGDMPTPTVVNFLKVLTIGFFSLVAGATLGPEAILVPACMLLGAFVGTRLVRNNKQVATLLAAAGLMALFTAFFNSIAIGVLSLFLVLSKSHAKFKPMLLIIAIIASVASKLTLNIVGGEAYIQMPSYDWRFNLQTLGACFILLATGYFVVLLIEQSHKVMSRARVVLQKKGWLAVGSVAALVLAGLMLLGGPLVEFTGNKSIVPMFDQAATLGVFGLVWILIVKILAISWSKAIGYRGGMIFPTIFIAAVMTAIAGLYVHDFNLIYGIIAVIIGALVANKKNHILV